MMYMIAEALGNAELCEVVNMGIKQGWRPLGGVTACPVLKGELQGETRLSQAMVKD